MSSYCHWSCPQTLASATPLSEPNRSISHVTTAADQSSNDCDRATGWYYFPGTRMVIKDVDGLPGPTDVAGIGNRLNRCGAESGLMHMTDSSELPQLGAAKASVTICTGACPKGWPSSLLGVTPMPAGHRLLSSQRLKLRLS